VDTLSASLKLLGDSLEAWMDLQRMWVYLEPIFAAPDIQRQLPEESQQFAAIDRSFRSQVLAVRERPNVMHAFSSATLLKACKQKNEALEHILVCATAAPPRADW
jgi:dynein heavy chain